MYLDIELRMTCQTTPRRIIFDGVTSSHAIPEHTISHHTVSHHTMVNQKRVPSLYVLCFWARRKPGPLLFVRSAPFAMGTGQCAVNTLCKDITGEAWLMSQVYVGGSALTIVGPPTVTHTVIYAMLVWLLSLRLPLACQHGAHTH